MQHLIHEVISSVIVAMLEIYLFLALTGKKLNSYVKKTTLNHCLPISYTEMLNVGNYSVLMEQQIHVHTRLSKSKLLPITVLSGLILL